MNADEAALYSWSLEPGTAIGLIVTALIYLRGWNKLRQLVPQRYPLWRLLSFLAGLATLYFSIASPLDAFASLLLISHMVQHLLLTMIAPPLILLGAPQLPMLSGLPKQFVSQGIGPFMHWPPLKALGRFILHPVVCLLLFMLSNVLWHAPGMYEMALRSSGWHLVEHACFLFTALLFWWHVVQPWPGHFNYPRWAVIPYMLLADVQNTILAAFLTFYTNVLYPTYAAAPRISGLSAIDDQQGAGAIMWVPGSLVFLGPAAFIAISYLSSKRNRYTPPPVPRTVAPRRPARGAFDLMRAPIIGPIVSWKYFRRSMQVIMLVLAAAVVIDGLLGPEISPMNLAGVLPWTHWRAFTVVALLAFGNFFCMACPFTFVRDLGRRILPANREWPRFLRSKWVAVVLLVIYLWAYEAFDLWDKPGLTAGVILAYFIGALLVDGIFRGASFCKYVCPIGQFHFVQSLVSPFEVKVRQPDVCASCRTYDCIKGNATQRGCELKLFQPRKVGNMDCTFCLDCVAACPHDNVGIIAVTPGKDLISDPVRSSVGRFGRRPDLAAVVLLLTFGAFANAAGMVTPVLNEFAALTSRFGVSDLLLVTVGSVLVLIVLPALMALGSAAFSARDRMRENLCRFAMVLAPLGFGMWLAHFVFHFCTASHTPIPVFQRIAHDLGWYGQPEWKVPSLAFYQLPGLELLFLDAGLLVALYVMWRVAGDFVSPARSRLRVALPWAIVALLLYLAGVWIIFQPMEMRGTLMH